MSKISDLLKEVGKDVLTEDSLKQIETAFNEAVETKVDDRAKIAIEAAIEIALAAPARVTLLHVI